MKTAKGFIVVGQPILINGIIYSGVNTDAWPIGTDFDSRKAVNIREFTYQDLAFPMLVDFDSAVCYYRSCECTGIIPRMLYCEALVNYSKSNLPQFDKPQNCTCLGFDYAYPSGDYYSAIANDIICNDRFLQTHWKEHLNKFGLLPTEDKLIQFAKARDNFIRENEKSGQELLFEKGNFIGFCVFQVHPPI